MSQCRLSDATIWLTKYGRFMMTCLCWILGFMRLELCRKIGLSGDWCLCTSLRTRSGACYIYGIYLCRYLACWCRSPPNLPSSSRESPADSCSLGAPDSRRSPIDSAAAADELRLSEITHAVIRNTQIRSVLFFSGPRIKGWPHHGRTFSIYMSSVILIDSSMDSPVHVLMLSIQALRGLSRLRAPGIVPCITSFSRQLSCFLTQIHVWSETASQLNLAHTYQNRWPGVQFSTSVSYYVKP